MGTIWITFRFLSRVGWSTLERIFCFYGNTMWRKALPTPPSLALFCPPCPSLEFGKKKTGWCSWVHRKAGAFRKLHVLSNTHTHTHTHTHAHTLFSNILVDSLFSFLSAISLSLMLSGRDFPLHPENLFTTALVMQNRLVLCLGERKFLLGKF